MGLYVERLIYCDADGCTRMVRDDEVAGPASTFILLRQFAREYGWTSTRSGLDYCPIHHAESGEE